MTDAALRPASLGPAPAGRREWFEFTGRAGEYFGIWIVNVLLTLVTFGIYSAWAKVRRTRYFYGCTRVAGATFDYHARPVQILVGRIIVVAFLVAYNVAIDLEPLVGAVLAVVFAFGLPWVLMRGIRFSARVTSYRNVRLDFTGGYWGAFAAFLLAPLLAGITLGILAPPASRWTWRYVVDHLAYGGRPVRTDPRIAALYGQWWRPALVVVAGLGLIGAIFGFGLANPMALAVVLPTALLVLFGTAGLLYRAGVRNVVLSSSVLDGRHRFVSAVERGRYLWIALGNIVATVLTLGLARPWAAVRMARFMAEATAVDVVGTLDDYVSEVRETGAAVAASYIDIEGFDFGF